MKKKVLVAVALSAVLTLSFAGLVGCSGSNGADSAGYAPASEDQQGSQGEGASGAPDDASDAVPAEVPDSAFATVEDVRSRMESDENLVLIDVRTGYEFKFRHVSAARNIPVKRLETRISEVPREASLVIVSSDEESADAAWAVLMEQGYDPNVITVLIDKNLTQWAAAGYDYIKTDPVKEAC